MANVLSKDKVRISYAEELEVRKQLERIAKERNVSLSHLIKEATVAYLKKQAATPGKNTEGIIKHSRPGIPLTKKK